MKFVYCVSWEEFPDNGDRSSIKSTTFIDFKALIDFLDLLEVRRVNGNVNDIYLSSVMFEVD